MRVIEFADVVLPNQPCVVSDFTDVMPNTIIPNGKCVIPSAFMHMRYVKEI